LGGDDVINASSLGADGIQLTMNGGLGADLFLGSEGGDLINGGDGNDTALMGAGNDTFVWNPGDDNDTLEGQDGTDTMLFNGANIAENINILANGGRVLFSRDIANVVMDLNDVETVDFNALGGADRIVVNDLSGTDVNLVNIDLAGTIGGVVGDNAADTIVINGTNGDDVILLSIRGDGALVVDGLAAQVVIEHFEPANDTITILGLAGDDVIDASAIGSGGPKLVFDAGAGNDILLGSGGADTLLGGAGDDVLLGNGGLDIIDGGDGDDIEIQGLTTVAATVDVPIIDALPAVQVGGVQGDYDVALDTLSLSDPEPASPKSVAAAANAPLGGMASQHADSHAVEHHDVPMPHTDYFLF
jgi:Ca2+-binding RTX toxin-like protein